MIAIAKTDQQAQEIARTGAAWTVGGYARPKKRRQTPALALAQEDRVNRYVDEIVIHG